MSTSGNILRPESRVGISEHVVHRDFPEQTVVLNLETGQYFGLNRTAGQMLSALEAGATLGAAAESVAQETNAPVADVEHDLFELCSSLLARGLIQPVDG